MRILKEHWSGFKYREKKELYDAIFWMFIAFTILGLYGALMDNKKQKSTEQNITSISIQINNEDYSCVKK